MKKLYIYPLTEVVAFDGPDFICTSTVSSDVTLPIDGSAIDNGVTDGDSRFVGSFFSE